MHSYPDLKNFDIVAQVRRINKYNDHDDDNDFEIVAQVRRINRYNDNDDDNDESNCQTRSLLKQFEKLLVTSFSYSAKKEIICFPIVGYKLWR